MTDAAHAYAVQFIETHRVFFDRRTDDRKAHEWPKNIPSVIKIHVKQLVADGHASVRADADRLYVDSPAYAERCEKVLVTARIDPHYDAALRGVLGSVLQEDGVIPRPLRSFAANAMLSAPLVSRRNEGKAETEVRNSYICILILELIRKHGLKQTRAFDVVAEASEDVCSRVPGCLITRDIAREAWELERTARKALRTEKKRKRAAALCRKRKVAGTLGENSKN